ncbi:cell wall hydrolase [Brevundimonas sp. M20]|uniref:cell wall hydrolase n=1 Tax=Brevundimonas sp. M20 TaxID=2591463 RepID=UPI0011469D01|nr:cell wall hydrolase [Brevundimonas sp. M20]QDH72588.1 cell wall hydrolase [Brevundimonas sp. M20]
MLTRTTLIAMMTRARRLLAAAPLSLAVIGVAMAASSTPRPEIDQRIEAVRRLTNGDLSDKGLAAIAARMTPSQLALAERMDPSMRRAALYGLTPGWENLTLTGKPTLDFGEAGLDALRLNAATPAVSGQLRAARPFVFRPATAEDRRRAQRCLTQAIYYEAALEPTEGQEAVAQVILNRVRDPNYANTVCGVVFEGAERVTGCQFSFTCDGALSQAPVAWAWERARKVADRALAGHVSARVGTATHYHADYVHPWWAPTLNKLTQIGAHIFYRWKGVYGEPSAFRQAYSGREPLIDEARFSRPRIQIPDVVTPAEADAALTLAAANGRDATRTVEINGQTRVVGVVSLGGRRQASSAEIAAINQKLAAFEAPAAAAPAPVAPGVTPMAVEEVGRPGS